MRQRKPTEGISRNRQAGRKDGKRQSVGGGFTSGSASSRYFKVAQRSPFRGRLARVCGAQTGANFSSGVEKLPRVSSNQRRAREFYGSRFGGCCLNLFRAGIERARRASGPGTRQLSAPAFSGGSTLHSAIPVVECACRSSPSLRAKRPRNARALCRLRTASRQVQHTSKLQPEFRPARVVCGVYGRHSGALTRCCAQPTTRGTPPITSL